MSHMRAVRTPLSCSRVALAVLVALVFHEGLATSISSSAVISSSGDAQDMEGKGRRKGKGKHKHIDAQDMKGKGRRKDKGKHKHKHKHKHEHEHEHEHKHNMVQGHSFLKGAEYGGSGPTTVIVGVSDSGTRGVEGAVMDVGWQVCKDALHPSTLDSDYTKDNHASSVRLLQKAPHDFGKQSKDMPEFQHAVQTETQDAKQVAECIRSSGGDLTKPWGYKNPDHIFLLPVLDSAFSQQTKYLLVARDPRDTASAHNQFQFESFGQVLRDGEDRLDYWGDVWKMVLDYYEDSHHARIIRVEDLVMPDPATNSKLYKVCNFMQLPDCSQDKVVTALKKMHSYKGEYMGHHYDQTELDRETLVNNVLAKRNQGNLFQSMGRLGYKVEEFGVTHPTSKLVL